MRDRSLNNDHAVQSNMIRSKLVGQVDSIASQSRSDIAFKVCNLSSNAKKPITDDKTIKTIKILLKIKTNPLKLKYPISRNIESYFIKSFGDASLDNLPTGKSTKESDEYGNCFSLN